MILELTQLTAGSTLEWVPRLTLLLLLACQPWREYMPEGTVAHFLGLVAPAMAIGGLLLPTASASPEFWFVFAGVHLGWVATAYYTADNHHYLQGYWCLSIAIAVHAGGAAGEQGLQRSAMLLLGLTFMFAVAAKMASRSYRDGSFFTAALLWDSRFIPIAVCVGLERRERAWHALALTRVRSGLSPREEVPVRPAIRRLGLWLTWWTIGIESCIAALFLLPVAGLDAARAAALLLFVATTFVAVPVPSFGQLLLVMLLAATDDVRIRAVAVILALGITLVSFIPQIARRVAVIASRKAAAVPSHGIAR